MFSPTTKLSNFPWTCVNSLDVYSDDAATWLTCQTVLSYVNMVC